MPKQQGATGERRKSSKRQGTDHPYALPACPEAIKAKLNGASASLSVYIVRKRIGPEDVFLLGEHIADTQYGIDSHHHTLLTLVVSLFFKLRLHHIAKTTTLSLQSGSMRQKLTKTVLFKGH